MIRQNLHTHTVFDDGKNTPMEMAQAALDAGLSSLGFSGHSVLPFPNDWAMTAERLPEYTAAVQKAKAAFDGRLEIYCGLEWDALSQPDVGGFDYIIGSVHHIPLEGGAHPSVDESPEASRAALAAHFSGDSLAMAEAYYARCAALAARPFADVVGHFDLITKFNEKVPLFDETAPLYRDAAMSAMEALLKADKIFEVNTGAMSRGWRTAPYPSRGFLKELRIRRGRVLVTSDAHSTEGIAHAFPEAEALLGDVGFAEIWEYTDRGFAPVPLG